jgi:hypothetical protein
MDKFARSVQVDSLRPGPKSCIESLRSNRLRRMSIDKSAVTRFDRKDPSPASAMFSFLDLEDPIYQSQRGR